jgi:hypothetical protein
MKRAHAAKDYANRSDKQTGTAPTKFNRATYFNLNFNRNFNVDFKVETRSVVNSLT